LLRLQAEITVRRAISLNALQVPDAERVVASRLGLRRQHRGNTLASCFGVS
jgi:hypothetical protein